jgi:hypothetical protein
MSRPVRITNLRIRLGRAADFAVASEFAEDLPVQILCKTCRQHLMPDWRRGSFSYRHPKTEGECTAPMQFAFVVAGKELLAETLRVVLDKTLLQGERTASEWLTTEVLFVLVEAVGNRNAIQVEIREPNVRAA